MGWGLLFAALLAAALPVAGARPGAAQVAAPAAAAPAAAISCGGNEIARAKVARVVDGRSFILDDGREVRLAAVEVPPASADGEAAPGGAAARDALVKIVSGAPIVLHAAEFKADRYGRVFAYAAALRDGSEHPVQAELIAAGYARVADNVGNRACATDLLRREGAARRAKLGLWADPYYETLKAENPVDVLAQRGRFALVEGKVVSVRESGATIYVNFGRRWTEEFAVTIRKRNERTFTAGGLDLKALAGRKIRVRGWIEERGTGIAPWIEAVHPEQIELADRD
jgi:endonuclease YncB( thermonuclease family)